MAKNLDLVLLLIVQKQTAQHSESGIEFIGQCLRIEAEEERMVFCQQTFDLGSGARTAGQFSAVQKREDESLIGSCRAGGEHPF